MFTNDLIIDILHLIYYNLSERRNEDCLIFESTCGGFRIVNRSIRQQPDRDPST